MVAGRRQGWVWVLLVAAPRTVGWPWSGSSGCGCLNAVPLSEVVETLERSLSSQVAGHERAKSRLLAAVRRAVWARAAGRWSAVRVHLSGPSGVGKSFVSRLVATSMFEESASYTGYRAAGLAATTLSTTAVMASQVSGAWATSLSPLTTALAAAPLVGTGAALAAVAGWRLVEYGESFWRVEPRPFPTQCGVAWWKFSAGQDAAEARLEVARALANAARAVDACRSAVLIFEDINRLPLEALRGLDRLTQPLLRAGRRAVSLQDAVVLFTSDLFAANETTAFRLEEAMPYDEAEAVVEAQARLMWGDRGVPSWWTRDVLSLPLAPLDDADLDAALHLYLHNDVPRAIRDALRFELAAPPSWWTSPALHWTGSLAYDPDVVDRLRDFVRRGPDDWRCHAITHFHATVLEPRLDAALHLLLHHSHTISHRNSRALTSSLLLRLEPRLLSRDTPLERLVYDASFELIHLPDDPAAASGSGDPAAASRSDSSSESS